MGPFLDISLHKIYDKKKKGSDGLNQKEQVDGIIQALKEAYPDALCSLQYRVPHELLIAVRLSAQCTDARVNLVTPALFERYRSISDFAAAQLTDVEALVKSCGFYHTKAQDIISMCRMLEAEYDGRVPDTIEELTRLPGVGRKTANLICGDVYGKPSYVCDTHCIRITNLLGLTHSKDPYKVEMELRECIPPQESKEFCHRMVLLGREYCIARRPNCEKCPLLPYCKSRPNAPQAD